MDKLSNNSENVIDFPISLESRLKALEASGNLTDDAIDQTLVDYLQPLILQSAHALAAMKAMQLQTNRSEERRIELIEPCKEP